MNLFTKQKQTERHRKQTSGYQRGEGKHELGGWDYQLHTAAAKSLQSCLTLCDPIDGSPPGSAIHGFFQARVLEWGAIAFSASYILVYNKIDNQQ